MAVPPAWLTIAGLMTAKSELASLAACQPGTFVLPPDDQILLATEYLVLGVESLWLVDATGVPVARAGG